MSWERAAVFAARSALRDVIASTPASTSAKHTSLAPAPIRGHADEPQPRADLEDALPSHEARAVREETRERDGRGPHDVAGAVELVPDCGGRGGK